MDKQLAYDFVEDGPDKRAKEFYDHCWKHYREQMRIMILSYVEAEGASAFQDYLAQEA